MTVVQVIDEKNLIADIGGSGRADKVTAWFTMPTNGVVDDQDYVIDQRIFEVVGTKKYETVAGGTKTIMHLVERSVKELAAK